MPDKPHNIPTTVTAEEGEVMLDGPDGLALSFTPDAAAKSANALATAAAKAGRQNAKGGDTAKPKHRFLP